MYIMVTDDTESYPNELRYLVFIVVAILLVGVFFSYRLGSELTYPDELEYLDMANNIVNDGTYAITPGQPTAYKSPGYPFLISVVLILGGSTYSARIVNFLLLIGCVLLIYKIVRREHDMHTSLCACTIAGFYPLFIYTSGFLYPQILSSFFFLAVFYLLLSNSVKSTAIAGAASGALILTTSIFLLFLPLFVGIIIVENRKHGFLNYFPKCAILLALTFTVLLPWMVRNYFTFGSIAVIATQGGKNLLLGNSKNTTPNAGVNIDISEYSLKGEGYTEIDYDEHYRKHAIHWIVENKVEALKLYFLKVVNHFNWRNELATKSQSSFLKSIISFLTYYPLILLVTARFFTVRSYRLSKMELTALITYLYAAFCQAIFVTRIRYRVPYDFLLISLAAISLVILYRRFRRERRT